MTDHGSYQEIIGDCAKLVVLAYGQTNEEVPYNSEQGDDDLGCNIWPFEVRFGVVTQRHG